MGSRVICFRGLAVGPQPRDRGQIVHQVRARACARGHRKKGGVGHFAAGRTAHKPIKRARRALGSLRIRYAPLRARARIRPRSRTRALVHAGVQARVGALARDQHIICLGEVSRHVTMATGTHMPFAAPNPRCSAPTANPMSTGSPDRFHEDGGRRAASPARHLCLACVRAIPAKLRCVRADG